MLTTLHDLAPDAVVVVTGDHGEHLGDHGHFAKAGRGGWGKWMEAFFPLGSSCLCLAGLVRLVQGKWGGVRPVKQGRSPQVLVVEAV